MKKIIFIFFAASFLMSCSTSKYSIMSYNVRNCKGLDNNVDFVRTSEIIKHYAPDFVALQELDSVTNRYGSKFALREIASQTNMNYSYASAIDYGGGRYGIGLLSKERPLSVVKITLPGSEEKRVLLVAEFEKIIVCCTHFSLTEADQLKSVEILCNVLAQFDMKYRGKKPILLAGDMNSTPDSKTQIAMRKYFSQLNKSAKTYPANAPESCIDYIYYFNPVRNNFVGVSKLDDVSAATAENVASDHLPVFLKIKF